MGKQMKNLTLFLVTFALVATKAFQQRNVAHAHCGLLIPTSAVFALFELLSIGMVAKGFIAGNGLFGMWLALAAGGGLGCLFSVWFHMRVTRR
jgi:hypothetical protein